MTDAKVQTDYEEMQKQMELVQIRRYAREEAIRRAPTMKFDNGLQTPLTASEIVKEAEIIYQWLINV